LLKRTYAGSVGRETTLGYQTFRIRRGMQSEDQIGAFYGEWKIAFWAVHKSI